MTNKNRTRKRAQYVAELKPLQVPFRALIKRIDHGLDRALQAYTDQSQPRGPLGRLGRRMSRQKDPQLEEGTLWKRYENLVMGYQRRVDIAQIDLNIDTDRSRVLITLRARDRQLLEQILTRALPEIGLTTARVLCINLSKPNN